MNHYETLGVSNAASQQEIKKSYRKLVKHFHPDINPNEGAKEHMIRINEAYEVLSDSSTRNLYDLFLEGVPVKTDIQETTPYERHREAYKRKRASQQREKIIYLVKLKTRFYRYQRIMNMAFFVFGVLLTIDYYYHPIQRIEEVKTVRQTRVVTDIVTASGMRFSTSRSFHDHFWYNHNVDEVTIKYSLFFKNPAKVSIPNEDESYAIRGTIYIFQNVFSIIILIFSAVVVKNKEYSDFRLSCGLVPGFFVLFLVLFLLTEL